MTSTKTKRTKLIVREKEFAQLLDEYVKLEKSIADSKEVLSGLGEQIKALMNKENLTSVSVDGVGSAEITQIGGSVTWDQAKLVQTLRNEINARQIDGVEFVAQVCKLTARESVAKSVNLDISEAKKVGKFSEKLVIK